MYPLGVLERLGDFKLFSDRIECRHLSNCRTAYGPADLLWALTSAPLTVNSEL